MPLDLYDQYIDSLHAGEWEECFIHSVLYPKYKLYSPELREWGLIDNLPLAYSQSTGRDGYYPVQK